MAPSFCHCANMCSTRPRWALQLEAMAWRGLMGIGMYIHTFSYPQPVYPSFTRTIDTTVSKKYPGQIKLHFYTPPAYVNPDDAPESKSSSKQGGNNGPGRGTVEGGEDDISRHSTNVSEPNSGGDGSNKLKVPGLTTTVDPAASTLSLNTRENRAKSLFPVVLSFHGGGFTIGAAQDDCRWAHAVTTLTNAVVVAVEYRLAPEYPFPTAIEDGVDALMYVIDHADELQLDVKRIVSSGFSAGGNMAFTVPLRWQYELRLRMGLPTDTEGGTTELPREAAGRGSFCAIQPGLLEQMSVSLRVPEPAVVVSSPSPTLDQARSSAEARLNGHISKNPRDSIVSSGGTDSNGVPANIVAICAWYPSVDFTNTREQRRATHVRADKGMPKFFTDLFDASYLYPPNEIAMSNPYLSPAVAPTGMLKGLPKDIMMYTCEWDELLAEAERLRDRLEGDELNKDVVYKKVMGVKHGWDKAPWGHDELRRNMYVEACCELRKVFYGCREELPGLFSPYSNVDLPGTINDDSRGGGGGGTTTNGEGSSKDAAQTS